MALFRHLLPVLAGAAIGCAATLLAQRYSDSVEHEHIVGPEAFDDAAEPASDTPAEPAEAEKTPAAPEAEQTPAEPEAPASVPAEDGVSTPAEVQYPPVDDTAPNPNPVRDHTDPAPTVDGKFDPTGIARPEDFANWDDLGCQG